MSGDGFAGWCAAGGLGGGWAGFALGLMAPPEWQPLGWGAGAMFGAAVGAVVAALGIAAYWTWRAHNARNR